MPELLPRFLKVQQAIEDERKLAAIILETGGVPDEVEDGNGKIPRMVLRSSADGHNRDRRRGLPMIGKGVGGASPGTNPVAALLAKEARGELHR